MRKINFGKSLMSLILVVGLNGCVSAPRNQVVIPETMTRVEMANDFYIEEIPESVQKYFLNENIPRRFVKGLTIKFDSSLNSGETDYDPKTKTISIHPDLDFVHGYSMSGFSQQLGAHVLANVFSEEERQNFVSFVDNYEQRAYPLFLGLDLTNASNIHESLEKISFLEPLRESKIPEPERMAQIIGYFYSDPYREAWNFEKISSKCASAIDSGKQKFSSEFYEFFKKFGDKKPKLKDVKFVFE